MRKKKPLNKKTFHTLWSSTSSAISLVISSPSLTEVPSPYSEKWYPIILHGQVYQPLCKTTAKKAWPSFNKNLSETKTVQLLGIKEVDGFDTSCPRGRSRTWLWAPTFDVFGQGRSLQQTDSWRNELKSYW